MSRTYLGVSEGLMGARQKGHRLDIEPDGRYCRYYLANLVVGQINAIPLVVPSRLSLLTLSL